MPETTSTSWVVGGGGLLGSAVVRELRARGDTVMQGPVVAWSTSHAAADLARGLAQLIALASGGPWQVFWCAGAAVTDSDPASLGMELETLRHFTHGLTDLAAETQSRGVVVFASSAGAVYGGSAGPPFTESTTPVPLGHYGAAKLRAEEILRDVATSTGLPVVIGRIANLYGPGQDLAKQQGIISRLCFSAVTRTPMSVFVPLDTLRDYIYVDDCARLLIACGRRASDVGSGEAHLKILASGRATTIGGVLGQFRHVKTGRPLVVMGSSSSATLQGRDLRLRSERWTDLDGGPATTLSAGIDRTMRDMSLTWVQPGRLAASNGSSLRS